MKQNVSPAVMAAIITVVVVVVGFVGFKLFLSGPGKTTNDPATKAKYDEMTKNGAPSKEDMAKNRPADASGGRLGMPR